MIFSVFLATALGMEYDKSTMRDGQCASLLEVNVRYATKEEALAACEAANGSCMAVQRNAAPPYCKSDRNKDREECVMRYQICSGGESQAAMVTGNKVINMMVTCDETDNFKVGDMCCPASHTQWSSDFTKAEKCCDTEITNMDGSCSEAVMSLGYTFTSGGKCQTSSGGDPAHQYHHGEGENGCKSLCDNNPLCGGYSVSLHDNCLLWMTFDLKPNGPSWGGAGCNIKNGLQQPPPSRSVQDFERGARRTSNWCASRCGTDTSTNGPFGCDCSECAPGSRQNTAGRCGRSVADFDEESALLDKLERLVENLL